MSSIGDICVLFICFGLIFNGVGDMLRSIEIDELDSRVEQLEDSRVPNNRSPKSTPNSKKIPI